MPRLHHDICRPETNMYPAGRAIHVDVHMSPDTSCSIGIHVDCISATITIHLCHGRLVGLSLCIQQQTGDKLATVLSPIPETS